MLLWLPLVSLVATGQAEVAQAGQSRALVARVAADQAVARQDLEEPVRVDDVEVRSRRGAALVSPEVELGGPEIDSLGAWDIGEVLQRLGETYDVGEAPLVVINGKRVANPGAFTGFPPDALLRAEVLPVEAAALYGGAPGQRVVNLVLQRQFQSYDGRVSGGRPTQGGTSSLSVDLRRSAIEGERTLQMGARVSRDTALRADERDREEGDALAGGAVTLRPATDLAALNLSMTRPLGDWSSVLSLNGQTRESPSRVRFGDEIVDSLRRNESLGGALGLSGKALGWQVQVNATGQASRARESGFGDTRSENRMVGLSGSVGRTLMELPAGPLVANFNGNLMDNRSTVERERGRTTSRFQTREARGSLAVPLAKAGAREGVSRGLGDLLATVGGGVRDTGAGSGDELSAALTWVPRQKVRLNGLWSAANEGISNNLRSEPLYHDAPRVVFDFRSGQAVEIMPIMGGNPDLRQPRSERLSLTTSLGPFTRWSLSANLGYHLDRTTNGVGSLPDLTEDVEAAFPERFRRDLDGRLISVDYRPLNFGANLTEGLTSSLNFNLPRPSGAVGDEATILRVSLNHSFRLRNTLSLANGLPELNRLKGDGGGVSRQDARLLIDARRGRWALNASARWQDGYRTRRLSGADGPTDLLLKPFASMDLKLSFQMTSTRAASVVDAEAMRRRAGGLQVSLEVSNLFDERPQARLGDGAPAPGYGRDLQDPIGRAVRLTLQRRF